MSNKECDIIEFQLHHFFSMNIYANMHLNANNVVHPYIICSVYMPTTDAHA